MRIRKPWFLVVIASLASSCNPGDDLDSRSSLPDLQGPYLGQALPGVTPKVFGPGVISTAKDEGGVVVSPGGRELFLFKQIV